MEAGRPACWNERRLGTGLRIILYIPVMESSYSSSYNDIDVNLPVIYCIIFSTAALLK
jgi:hypothetical protein